jgi:hypothetical protein
MTSILPLLPQLVSDSESIIRQHLATQLLPLCLTCMFGDDKKFNPADRSNFQTRVYNEGGYAIATVKLVNHMTKLITDPDMDVRKAASDAMATLALYIKSHDIPAIILRIPLQLLHDAAPRSASGNESPNEDLCITASHLLADIASIDPIQVPPIMVSHHITPTILALCQHSSFRVRRAAVQALPRVVSGSTVEDVRTNLIPAYMKMSSDQGYRVRKSIGECLVDMSRSLMLLGSIRRMNADGTEDGDGAKAMEERKLIMQDLRRKSLVPTCTKLLEDNVKAVRHSMMQFLGPFIASFYPLDGANNNDERDDGIINTLSGKATENLVGGMGVQFFPHANGMVSRLSPETISSPTFIPGISQSPEKVEPPPLDTLEYFQSLLPKFMEKCDNDSKSLVNILRHREKYPPPQTDIGAVKEILLPPYVKLASMSTGDDNVDAEMRVYCAYSLPAVVLLLGKESWDKSLKKCFLKLITDWTDTPQEATSTFVPLPVKRCLASSFHTICNVLGSAALKGTTEEKANKLDLLTVFEIHFLRDADDTVRLNVIRNLPSFLSLLSFSKRSKYLPVLYEIIRGDTMLASKRKNALNPILLNWRQRDMIAQIMPNLISLYRPDQVRQYLWPIVKILLSDSVNLFRQNIEWSIPILLKSYEFKNCMLGRDDASLASKFSAEACNEVFEFLKATLLENKLSQNKITASGAFSKRQSYCRILSSVALSLRLNENKDLSKKENGNGERPYLPHPFYTVGKDSYKHLHHLLKSILLPPALAMKDDKVTNVRLTLAKSLRVMPVDIRDSGEVSVILRTLEDEIETWEGGGGQNMDVDVPKVKVMSTISKILENNAGASSVPLVAGSAKSKIRMSGQQTQGDNGDTRIARTDSNEDDSSSLASI